MDTSFEKLVKDLRAKWGQCGSDLDARKTLDGLVNVAIHAIDGPKGDFAREQLARVRAEQSASVPVGTMRDPVKLAGDYARACLSQAAGRGLHDDPAAHSDLVRKSVEPQYLAELDRLAGLPEFLSLRDALDQ